MSSGRYQMLPPLSAEEYETLKAGIAERGVLVPVEYDEEGNILDGYHRVQACGELGIADWPRVVREGLTDDQKAEHAILLNIARRHLPREWKQAKAAELRQQGWSYRRIAKVLGVVEGSIRFWLGETGAQNYAPDTIVGSDGKHYPSTYTRAEAPTPEEPTAPSWQSWGGEAPATQTVSHPPIEIPTPERPHIAYNSGENEWYTPPHLLEAARRVMGSIDCDPASSDIANKQVQAATYYTVEQDGLAQAWAGNVWMNPPYSQPQIRQFAEGLVQRWHDGEITQATVLVNNATDTRWMQVLLRSCSAVCFLEGRVRFLDPGGNASGAPLQGQAVLYFGDNANEFAEEFGGEGVVFCA